MKCKYPDEVCASMTVLNGVAYCDSVPCVLRDEIPPMTNADRIRSLSDEELAAILLAHVDCEKERIMCCPSEYKDSGKCNGKCIDGRLAWLRQPCQEGAEQK